MRSAANLDSLSLTLQAWTVWNIPVSAEPKESCWLLLVGED